MAIVLNRKEVKKIYYFSEKKYRKIVSSTTELYNRLIKSLKLEKEKPFFNSVEKAIVEHIYLEKDDVFKRKLWEDGWMKIDPFFLPCFKTIFPLVYLKFYKKGTNTAQLKKSFSSIAINERFKEVGGKTIEEFLSVFSREGTNYYHELSKIGILKKFGRKERELDLKGIPKGVIYDILRYMRKIKK
jgi:hypothetical protein